MSVETKDSENKQEVWRNIEPPLEKYMVSTFGRVRNEKGQLLTQRQNVKGYYDVAFKPNQEAKTYHRPVHRLVALAFVPKEDGKDTVDHIDRNPANNNASNLRWATRKEQAANRKERNGRKVFRIATTENGDREMTVFPSVPSAAKAAGIATSSMVYRIESGCQIEGVLWKYGSQTAAPMSCSVCRGDRPEMADKSTQTDPV